VVVVVKWLREEQVTLTWVSALSPLLITLPLLHNQVLVDGANYNYYQTTADNFMNWKHVPDNLAHAGAFLFSPDDFLFSPDNQENNSLLLSVLGVPALLLTLVGVGLRLGKRWREQFCDDVPVLGEVG
jgi:hypothetical protein